MDKDFFNIDIDRALKDKRIASVSLDNGDKIVVYDASWIGDHVSRSPYRWKWHNDSPQEAMYTHIRKMTDAMDRFCARQRKPNGEAMRPEDV